MCLCVWGVAQQTAFPGAEGAGRFTSGGRGTSTSPTTVFEVTNLTDINSPGSLRYALQASTTTYVHRTIVFRVSGTIHLTSKLNIRGNCTIAGQTAPGDGICIADHPVVISGDNVIVRYLRIRMGDKNQNLGMVDGSGGDDAFGNLGNKNIIVDHCSISWSSDEACTFYRGDSLTLQWNFIEEPLNYSYHFESGDTDFEEHGYGGIWGARRGSFHHNLIAHFKGRGPRFAGSSTYTPGTAGQENGDFRNNVIYNWIAYSTNGGDGGNYNMVNNYYKYGPNTSNGTTSGIAIKTELMNPSLGSALPYPKLYITGNYMDGSSTVTSRNWLGVAMAGGTQADTLQSKVDVPFDIAPLNMHSATEAFELVLNSAGATLPRRDTMDRRIVNDVRYRVGKVIDVQGGFPHGTPYAQTVDAWPNLASAAAPADTDHDGMPDTWETANSLNPNDASDRQGVAANGYTNLENYLNSITNVSPEVYFSGVLGNFTQPGNAPSATQTIVLSGERLTGAVTLTPPAGFEVSVDGSNWFSNSNPLVLNPGSGIITNTNLMIRLNAATLGNYAGNLVATTSGVGNFYVKLNGNRTGSSATTQAASATWTLLTDGTPTITGDITATSQALGSAIAGTSYGSSFGGITGWQRSANTTFLPIGYNANAYVEYTITPGAAKYFTASSISLNALGGGTGTAKMAVYYSFNNFNTSTPAGSCTYNGTTTPATQASPVSLLNTSTASLTGQQAATIPVNISVPPGTTLSLRIYVWITGSGDRYFASKSVVVDGVTSDQSLPLKLTGFSAVRDAGKTSLSWSTQNEVNVKSFGVERSQDGQRFSGIGSVNAKNTSAKNEYDFYDMDKLEGTIYYRLKMLDKDGAFVYSNTVAVQDRKQAAFTISPNPAGAIILIRHNKMHTGATIQVVAADGKLLLQQTITPGSEQTIVSTTALTAGKYNLVIKDDKQVQTGSFIKL